MVRLRFQQSLDDLKERLLVMAGMAEQAIQRAIEAYRTRDISICDLVDHGEQAIDRFEREIDQMALDLLAMEQPMAIDLRFILAVIKINADLERIGDQSMSIARRAKDMLRVPPADLPIDIAAMGLHATDMIRRAVQALIEADAVLAESVREMDDEIDHMNRTAHKALIRVMQESPTASLQALNAIITARNLERIADHATNIATDVIFWVRGADVRHQLALAE
jgi:phosphate transport system protein